MFLSFLSVAIVAHPNEGIWCLVAEPTTTIQWVLSVAVIWNLCLPIEDDEVLNYESSHNHPEIGYICPEYKTIKTQITRYKNKQLFSNINTLDEAPNESEYYKTIRGEYFMIFKNSNIIIFQSPFQAKLFMENKHIFDDGTFLIAPTNSYQVFITRTYATELNCFYTTSIYESTCSQFLNFLDYFEKTFLNIYNIKYWNYYNNMDHITNNASESFNSYLKIK
ncbi:hypothetical protein H8356DRAFT_1344201 [Neocallimastix lanati (nom. inval.)]|nr:hypothetical protein H8356DRAFT_1344201 [Neocallimastix sp. JGI-2020a]